jgi:hypothetical protein
MTNENAADFLARVGMDANLWTQEFIKNNPDLKDESVLVAWFANMIMAGYDCAGWKTQLQIEKLKKENEVLREGLKFYADEKHCLKDFESMEFQEPGTTARDALEQADKIRG